MDMRQVLAAEQIRYHKVIAIVERILQHMGIEPVTKIFVHPMYPTGWEARVAIDEHMAFVFISDQGAISLREENVVGFYPSGVLKTECAYRLTYHNGQEYIEECPCGLCGFA